MCLSNCKTRRSYGENQRPFRQSKLSRDRQLQQNKLSNRQSKKIMNRESFGEDKIRRRSDEVNENIENNEYILEFEEKSDEEFYNNLQNYHTMCYSGEGYAVFLKNQGWLQPLWGLFMANGFLGLSVILLFIFVNRNEDEGEQFYQNQMFLIILVDVLIILLLNLTYLLTIFINPGIRNLSKISADEYEKKGKTLCSYCKMFRTNDMRHCRQCKACVSDMDHHCGYFNKCIAGPQQYFFNACLLMLLVSFLATIVNFITILS